MPNLQERLGELAAMPTRRLRAEWRQAFHTDPAEGLTRDLLMRAVAYRAQEQMHGGLTQTTKRALRQLTQRTAGEGAADAPKPAPTMMPGVRLVRNWRGKAHTVLVLENGFEYAGERYRSLTEIARRITGSHWSGPRFFGVGPAATRHRESRVEKAGADGQI
jgi:hypothetical protein